MIKWLNTVRLKYMRRLWEPGTLEIPFDAHGMNIAKYFEAVEVHEPTSLETKASALLVEDKGVPKMGCNGVKKKGGGKKK